MEVQQAQADNSGNVRGENVSAGSQIKLLTPTAQISLTRYDHKRPNVYRAYMSLQAFS